MPQTAPGTEDDDEAWAIGGLTGYPWSPANCWLGRPWAAEQATVLAQAEFGETIKDQGELIAPHNRNLKAIFQKHVQDRLMSLQLREMYDEYPPPV